MTDATPRVFQTSGSVWLKDFEFGLTGLTVRKTGARVPYSPTIISQVTAWFRYFFAAKAITPIEPRFTIFFTPERARWVGAESWHPHQRGEYEPDGSYLP